MMTNGDSEGQIFLFFFWLCSLAVPVLAGWVYVYGGSMSRNS